MAFTGHTLAQAAQPMQLGEGSPNAVETALFVPRETVRIDEFPSSSQALVQSPHKIHLFFLVAQE